MKTIHNLLKIILMTVLFAFDATAQDRVTITQNEFALKGDFAQVEFQIDLSGAKIRKRSFVLLTPVIQKDNMTKEMPAVLINGKNRHKAYLRVVKLRGEPAGLDKVINTGDKNTPHIHHYANSVPYEPWMEDASFSVREEQCKCNGPLVKIKLDSASDKIQDLNQFDFKASFMVPDPEPVKTRSESGKANLDFVVDKYDILPNFRNNAAELSKISGTILKVKNEPSATITGISIDGYASPEASYQHNLELSKNRSIALKDYLCKAYNLEDDLFTVRWHGEDWKGLEALLAASNLAYKDQALRIIRNIGLFEGREKMLMDLQGGRPYRDMLQNLFPELRRAEYEVQYIVAQFSVEEGKKVLETNPGLLSLNEMFLIAQTYPEDSKEFQRVFDLAVETYPESDIAIFNAAANALEAQNIDAAQMYLNKAVNHDAAFENNLGILNALQGNLDKAAELFRKAAGAGNAEAAHNLAEIKKPRIPNK